MNIIEKTELKLKLYRELSDYELAPVREVLAEMLEELRSQPAKAEARKKPTTVRKKPSPTAKGGKDYPRHCIKMLIRDKLLKNNCRPQDENWRRFWAVVDKWQDMSQQQLLDNLDDLYHKLNIPRYCGQFRVAPDTEPATQTDLEELTGANLRQLPRRDDKLSGDAR